MYNTELCKSLILAPKIKINGKEIKSEKEIKNK